jgi:hypothetical protein
MSRAQVRASPRRGEDAADHRSGGFPQVWVGVPRGCCRLPPAPNSSGRFASLRGSPLPPLVYLRRVPAKYRHAQACRWRSQHGVAPHLPQSAHTRAIALAIAERVDCFSNRSARPGFSAPPSCLFAAAPRQVSARASVWLKTTARRSAAPTADSSRQRDRFSDRGARCTKLLGASGSCGLLRPPSCLLAAAPRPKMHAQRVDQTRGTAQRRVAPVSPTPCGGSPYKAP